MKPQARFLSTRAVNALGEARGCLQNGDASQAQKLCHEVLAEYPEQADAQFMLGLVDLQHGRAEAALQRLQAALSAAPDNLDAQAALGSALFALSRPAEAASAYAAVLERAPDAIDVRAHFAVALQQSGAVEQAIEQYRIALAARPNDAYLHFNLGTAHKRLHEFDAAVDAYRRADALAPNDVSVVVALATALLERGLMADAADAFQRVVALDASDAESWCSLGYTRIRSGNAQGAADAAREFGRRSDPGSGADDLLSNALLSGGDSDGALEICNRTIARSPANIQSHADRSIALAAKGLRDEARQVVDFDRFLQVSQIAVPAGFDDIEAFNSALLEHLRAHPDLRFDFSSISCHNGQTSGEILIEPKGPVAELESILIRAGEDYRQRLGNAAHPWLQGAPQRTELSAWCTVLRSQGYQHGHIHPTSWLSGVYYLRLPRRRADAAERESPDRAGWIEFGRTPEHYPAGDQGEIRYVDPKPGTLVLFPSFVYHRTVAFDSDDERATIAFDFRPPGFYEN